MRRRKRYRDSESSKRRLPTDRLRLMLLERREPSRKVRDRPERGRDSSTRNARESLPILKSLDRLSLLRSKSPLPSKPESRERTT